MKQVLFIILCSVALLSCNSAEISNRNNEDGDVFSFAFMTDIHLDTRFNAVEGFKQALDTVVKMNCDFVLTGGDNIVDATRYSYKGANKQFELYKKTISEYDIPFYNAMGNHDNFGIFSKKVNPNHQSYGKKLFEEKLGKRYYSFNHKGWHFIVLDGIYYTEGGKNYVGRIDSVQVEWLKNDLKIIGTDKPVVLCNHMPFLSIKHFVEGKFNEPIGPKSMMSDTKEFLKIIEGYNVKIVLQGHEHFLEDINYKGIHFITGGAVSSDKWRGKRDELEEGFLKINIHGEKFSWDYIDFGWDAKAEF